MIRTVARDETRVQAIDALYAGVVKGNHEVYLRTFSECHNTLGTILDRLLTIEDGEGKLFDLCMLSMDVVQVGSENTQLFRWTSEGEKWIYGNLNLTIEERVKTVMEILKAKVEIEEELNVLRNIQEE